MKNNFFILFIGFIIALLDQLTKHLIIQFNNLGERITLIKGFISIFPTFNTGAAFSILEGHPLMLSLMSLVASFAIAYYIVRNRHNLPSIILISWSFIFGGTVGNLIDRLFLGYVIDFIKLDFINFPIFNFADIAINIGAFILIYSVLFEKENIKIEKR